MIIIPDTHGRKFWKEAVKYKRDDEKIIFLGDYLEPYDVEGISHQDAYDNFLEIIEYKKQHIDDCILLLGNHDFACIDTNMISCRHDYKNAERNTKTFIDNMNLFSLVYSEIIDNKKHIFSHAGIKKEWLEYLYKSIDKEWLSSVFNNNVENIPIDELLNKMFIDDATNSVLKHYLSIYSNYRGWSGYNVGSCIWSDVREWDDKEYELDNTYQIFGHTQLISEPIITEYWAELDCRQAFRLENNKITKLINNER